VTKRLPTQGDRPKRALSQADGTPKAEIEEITDRIEMLQANPLPSAPPMSEQDLSMILAKFEANLGKLNVSLGKEARVNRTTVKTFSDECEKTKESVSDLNTELNLVVRREVG